MSNVYILQNQHKLFLTRQGEWTDGRDSTPLYRTANKDEALNQLFETNAKDYDQRISVIECETGSKGAPIIKDDWLAPINTNTDTNKITTTDESLTQEEKASHIVENSEHAPQINGTISLSNPSKKEKDSLNSNTIGKTHTSTETPDSDTSNEPLPPITEEC
ncbi:hypothetical protein [Marinibactrum halimedae]|uniref:Uncharacterized protein n=1 Tax=Marinibactrum halimedae TaxID=1444977 RepID=A0AA37T925_9GAMM|nr:hypothetical protein [Marinibactrum halimedae]MCD9458251.1 hypothetical protein [Marinibactrum halimedae]GLS27122.1 hypothetical protein GCM10007877_28410 [Marinibactrum halimedae]